jgi:hypothetical protein
MGSNRKRIRDYAYLSRIARGLAGGKSRSQARRHARAADLPSEARPQPFKRSESQQDDLRPLNVLHWTPSVLDDPLHTSAMLSREEKRDSLSHSSRLARLRPSVNPPFASVH